MLVRSKGEIRCIYVKFSSDNVFGQKEWWETCFKSVPPCIIFLIQDTAALIHFCAVVFVSFICKQTFCSSISAGHQCLPVFPCFPLCSLLDCHSVFLNLPLTGFFSSFFPTGQTHTVGEVALSQAMLILLFQSRKKRSWALMMMSRKTPMTTARVITPL